MRFLNPFFVHVVYTLMCTIQNVMNLQYVFGRAAMYLPLTCFLTLPENQSNLPDYALKNCDVVNSGKFEWHKKSCRDIEL